MNSSFPYQHADQNGQNALPPPPQHQAHETTDAVKQRFLERPDPPETSHCLSCGGTFQKQTIADVIKHYADQPHTQFHSPCLYCRGKVHRYRDGRGELQYYHDCYRSTKKLDQ
ncbi:uncharacterized protein LOC109422122 [Aedes albopictus]|uniref:LIM zinc-binding domain-containing protein n=1 Tax=Aedes albopictus TaxID=7160 RepID=A0ABM1XUY2_AEDAL|nr:hypothetical protein RP20_CCG008265 [Aedes albopictus]